ncbi:MAG: ABA4-like family protein [Acidobacteria bacterium]|nr:ABA4-like family protein [Acidobacteriota bacterium]
MEPETLFTVATRAVLPGWLLLILLPRWRWSSRLISAVVLPGLLGLVYLWLIVNHWGTTTGGGYDSLSEVSTLFSNPWLLLAGWVHYLAFDLFIGAWEVRDAQREKIHHLLVVPCLVLTFLFGPVGLVGYLGLRGISRRRLQVDEGRADA